MKNIRVLLLHGGRIPHYRIPIYNYLSRYLLPCGYDLIVSSAAIQPDNPHEIKFHYKEIDLSIINISRLIYREKIDIIIMFVDMRDYRYLFPTYLVAKGIMGKKMLWWGQGRDLADQKAILKNLAYTTEHALCDGIILYADHLKKYVNPRFHKKTFIANNTLCINYPGLNGNRADVLKKWGISTNKNIICVGRLQKRKRVDDLVAAYKLMNRSDIGLILVGPDTDGVLDKFNGENIYKLGPIYGKEMFDLISASDVYCLPGAVGLSIVDGFHCGLPFVTDDGDESAEIMYLEDGRNGFVTPRGNIKALAEKLLLIIDDDRLREQFSEAARRTITEKGSITNMCAGFHEALAHITRNYK